LSTHRSFPLNAEIEEPTIYGLGGLKNLVSGCAKGLWVLSFSDFFAYFLHQEESKACPARAKVFGILNVS